MNTQPQDLNLVFLVGIGITILMLLVQLVIIYVYRQDNNALRENLSKCHTAMRAERFLHREAVLNLQADISKLKTKSKDSSLDGSLFSVMDSEPLLLKCSQTFDASAPQYAAQSMEYLTMISRTDILKDAANYIKTDVQEIRPRVYKFSHELMIYKVADHA